jgi:phenylacetate-CoA ligase
MYSWLLKKGVLPIADKVMGTSVSSKLNQIQNMEQWSRDRVEEWHDKKLQAIIHHAYNNTAYYKQLFDKQGLKPSDIQSRSDLSKVPILTKKDIRENFEKIVPLNVQTIPHKKAATGGSTGEPLKYYLDLESWSFSNANKIYNWEKTGYKYGDKHIALGSTSLFIEDSKSLKHKIYYGFKNKIGLNGVNMSADVCAKYVELLKKEKVKYIYGYASSIYLLAKYVSEKDLEMDIKACYTTSEILTDSFRSKIKEAFNCIIVDCYGAHDGGITAFSHKKELFELSYNSIIRQKKRTEEGIGSVLVTDLLNYALPFINYELGDEVLINENLENTYNGQTINKVLGRSSDVIELENGDVLTGPGFTILFKDLPVEYYSIEKKGDNHIKCQIKKLDKFNEMHYNVIESTFNKHLGKNSTIEITFTEEFELTKSGKLKYFKS